MAALRAYRERVRERWRSTDWGYEAGRTVMSFAAFTGVGRFYWWLRAHLPDRPTVRVASMAAAYLYVGLVFGVAASAAAAVVSLITTGSPLGR